MDQFNLLDLDNDNHDKMKKERVKQILKKELYNFVDYDVEKLRKTIKNK